MFSTGVLACFIKWREICNSLRYYNALGNDL